MSKKTDIYLRPVDSLEEHEKETLERYEKNAKEHGFKDKEYYYPYAYGALTSAYKRLHEEYMLLKEYYESTKKEQV